MKLVKMSLAAAVLLGASAFAIDNVKVDGDAKLYYYTNNAEQGVAAVANASQGELFSQGSSAADTALRLGVTGDLTKGVSFGATVYGISTLGLENNLVGNTWTHAHNVKGNNSNATASADSNAWVSELWVAATLGKTTAKLGRMALDTPLAFSETWSIVPNTFEAAVLLNQDIPDTTLVGAWVGNGNGTNSLNAATTGAALGIDGVVSKSANFNTFGTDGAYAAAVVNNSFKPLTVQAWYYGVVNVADAVWLQADLKCKAVPGLIAGAQYTNMDTKGILAAAKDSSAYAAKIGYTGVENLVVSGAYSSVDKDSVLKIANVATRNLANAQSKLYTEAYWNYGYVGAAGAESWNATAEYDIKDMVKLGAYYTDATLKPTGSTNYTNMTEMAVSATSSFGPLDATLAYVSTQADDQNVRTGGVEGSDFDTVLAMLKLNF